MEVKEELVALVIFSEIYNLVVIYRPKVASNETLNLYFKLRLLSIKRDTSD